jgi:hypothetical protein
MSSDAISTAADALRVADTNGVHIEARPLVAAIGTAMPTIPVTRHPLGFYHFDLSAWVGAPYRLRFHLWPSAGELQPDDLGLIHDHTWSLRSLVVIGDLIDIDYEGHQDANGRYFAVEARYDDAVIAPTGKRYSLQQVRERHVAAGEIYDLPPGVLHRTRVTEHPTATFVLAEEMAGRTATILSLNPLSRPLPSGREQVDPTAALAAVERVLNAL